MIISMGVIPRHIVNELHGYFQYMSISPINSHN